VKVFNGAVCQTTGSTLKPPQSRRTDPTVSNGRRTSLRRPTDTDASIEEAKRQGHGRVIEEGVFADPDSVERLIGSARLLLGSLDA